MAYVEEPRRSRLDMQEEMGLHGGLRLNPCSASETAFMVYKVPNAAVWEDLKDIGRPMYHGNPPQSRPPLVKAGRLGNNRH